ncbi:MAG: hypothetical protein IKY66_04710 [Bacteroidales bacterium]|nr:hypothetical protein [Bacteroidales bacterium]
MRKTLLLLLALLLPLSAIEMSADDEDAVMKIPLYAEEGTNLNRSSIQLPIDCHYFGMMNSLVTTVWSDLGDVVLTVTNCSTGRVWYDSFDSALEPQTMLTLSGEPGIYQIVYITESGDVYEGTFITQ